MPTSLLRGRTLFHSFLAEQGGGLSGPKQQQDSGLPVCNFSQTAVSQEVAGGE